MSSTRKRKTFFKFPTFINGTSLDTIDNIKIPSDADVSISLDTPDSTSASDIVDTTQSTTITPLVIPVTPSSSEKSSTTPTKQSTDPSSSKQSTKQSTKKSSKKSSSRSNTTKHPRRCPDCSHFHDPMAIRMRCCNECHLSYIEDDTGIFFNRRNNPEENADVIAKLFHRDEFAQQ